MRALRIYTASSRLPSTHCRTRGSPAGTSRDQNRLQAPIKRPAEPRLHLKGPARESISLRWSWPFICGPCVRFGEALQADAVELRVLVDDRRLKWFLGQIEPHKGWFPNAAKGHCSYYSWLHGRASQHGGARLARLPRAVDLYGR